MDRLELDGLEGWRAWLRANQLTSTETWIVIRKRDRDPVGLTMKDAVDEAICFGWIDSRTKRLDDSRYTIRFTPRKNDSNWSARNLKRARELIAAGRMTESGLSKLPSHFQDLVDRGDEVEELEPAPDLEAVLRKDPEVWLAYSELPPGKRKEFNRWVLVAKRPETREGRIKRTLELVRMGRSLTEEMMGRWAKK